MEEQDRLTRALADRYQIEGEIGSGGMATVYLARDLRHERQVAVKVLDSGLAQTLGAERFLREIKTVANLTHPHILPVFDSGEAAGFLYFVMPYVEGESLRERLNRETQLPVEDAVRITREVAGALAYAHERGVIHRDVKPANIMLEAGHAVLADFGVAYAVAEAEDQRMTRAGTSVGTPGYMSPEQASGELDLDGRSDQYALACVLYEMLAGEPPYTGLTSQAVVAKLLSEPVPRVTTLRDTVPPGIEQAVTRALAKTRADRFPSSAAFAEALTQGPSGAAMPRGGVAAGGRRRRVLAGAAVAAVALVGWGIASVVGRPSMGRLAVLPMVDLSNDPEQGVLAAGIHQALISELGQLGLDVIERRTMVQYRGQVPDTDQGFGGIARELRVDGVVEGSFSRWGDSLEITTRLYDRNERELWTGNFAGAMPNILALYRRFARAIAGQIRLSLRPEVEARLGESAPVNPEVYAAYLRGMHALGSARSKDDLYEAIGYLTQATEQNPADALAYAGLAIGYATLGHDIAPPLDAWPRAREAAERAIRLDSTLAEGWAALADYRAYSGRDWDGAEEAFRRANQLNPSLALNHFHYSWYLALFGRVEEAFAEHRRAQELDPMTPLHTVYIPALHWFVRDYEQALVEARTAVEQFPQSHRAYFVLGESAAQLGLYDEAIEAYEKMVTLFPDRIGYLGHTLARAGRTEEALAIVEQFEAGSPTPGEAQGLALIYCVLGDRDEALRWLEHEPAHAWLAWVITSWYHDFDGYREDPRFQALLRKVNLRYEPGDRWPTPLPVVHPDLPGLSE